LGDPAAVLSSANGTWVDRVEAAAVRASAKRSGRAPAMSSLAGYFAETFSVTPLAGVAAVLLGRKVPISFGGDAAAAATVPAGESGVGVICTDYSGTVAGRVLAV
jgi:hypothetical protein